MSSSDETHTTEVADVAVRERGSGRYENKQNLEELQDKELERDEGPVLVKWRVG